MGALILSYLGGVLTILSPCVLPVVPFIFARSDRPFRKSGLPMLIGMGLSFALFATFSAIGGSYIVQTNQLGRGFALVVFAVLGASLIFPKLAEGLTRPVVRLGGVLQSRASSQPGLGSSLLLGASVGLLWAPCAGPILGLVLAGATLSGSAQKTFGLLLVFALGAATSLGVAIFTGNQVLSALKKSLGAEEWIKKAIGVTVLGAVVAISFKLDTKLLAKFSFVNTRDIEQALIERTGLSGGSNQDEGISPALEGAAEWLNSAPLSLSDLKGKVVLVDFWTYSCINCIRTLPHLKTWYEKYKDQGLVIIGVHTPEFAFEKSGENVKNAVKDFGIQYPVAVDSNQTIWSAFKNQYWPAHYFIDGRGRIRSHHFGEGNYAESEKLIQTLLAEIHPGKSLMAKSIDVAHASGIEAPPSGNNLISPETYLGYSRQEGFVSLPEIQKDSKTNYKLPNILSTDQWGVQGEWRFGSEAAVTQSSGSRLAFRFHARDLNLVIGAPEGKTLRFRVSIDGKPPRESHGQDIDEDGRGKVQGHRLYQLIRLPNNTSGNQPDHSFQIEFYDSDVEVFAFTFG